MKIDPTERLSQAANIVLLNAIVLRAFALDVGRASLRLHPRLKNGMAGAVICRRSPNDAFFAASTYCAALIHGDAR
jgi:hypothetical protein